jgi:hypothetical protein
MSGFLGRRAVVVGAGIGEPSMAGVLPPRDLGLSLVCLSRPLIELVLRRLVKAIANIALRPRRKGTGIVPAIGCSSSVLLKFSGLMLDFLRHTRA